MGMKPITDKDIKDYCKSCDVEPPAMRFKCPVCKHNPDKEQIMIDGGRMSGITTLQDQLTHKIQECEELKRKVDEYKEALEELREECEEHRNNAESYCASYQSSCVVNAEITDIAYKYGQALNNIKNYIYKQECENCRCISCKTPKDILDIISRAKDGK